MHSHRGGFGTACLLGTGLLMSDVLFSSVATAGTPAWADTSASPQARAQALVAAMTLDEKILLLHGSIPPLNPKPAPDAIRAAGHVPGIARLGIPALRETDASLGVANSENSRPGDVATALPSGLMLAATWSPALAYAGGVMIGGEARAKRFNVMLAGGMNLSREPRNGRDFEYAGEDPLLAGQIAGEMVRGIQSNGIVSTVKHFALNSQETRRHSLNAKISEAAARESDLLAFQIAIERGKPGAVMTSYNRVNGVFASESPWLLTTVLKHDWGFDGWVMSDWGGVHSTAPAAMAGLDQESGEELDALLQNQIFFDKELKRAVDQGEVPMTRIDDMVTRYLRTLIAHGIYDRPDTGIASIDYAANAAVAEREAEQGIVLLKNDRNLLPLAPGIRSIAVIGVHADIGVLSGAGSSQVRPVGGPALVIKVWHAPTEALVERLYHPSSPMRALQAQFPGAAIRYADGTDRDAAVAVARNADVAIVFAEQWRAENFDVPTLALPDGQDALIAAVAAANPRTIVGLQTGGAALMPWIGSVGAVFEAWYPGQRGGEAIARLLAGVVNPSGRLPITFPVTEQQLPRPKVDGLADDGALKDPSITVDYDIEGANVGYKWYAAKGVRPLFHFGYGLSYTAFQYSDLKLTGGRTITARLRVANRGDRAGIATPQFYAQVAVRGQAPVPRLIGWQRVALEPGASREIDITADPRLLAEFDTGLPGWRINGGKILVTAGDHVGDTRLKASAMVDARTLKP